MKVAKWGNSLGVRLPKAVTDALDLKEGDDIQITIAGDRKFEAARDPERQAALERIKAMRFPLPKGYRFNREEANERPAILRHKRSDLRVRGR